MTSRTVHGYTLLEQLALDGSHPYFARSPDDRPVLIRLRAAGISNAEHAEAVENFLRRYLQIGNASLLAVRDWWIEAESLAIVTDWPDGGSFDDRLRQHGPVRQADLVSLLTPLGEAADVLHNHRILHGDIRPATLLLRHGAPHLDVPRLPPGGSGWALVFTWSFTAPEVFRGAECPHSDQYSLAAAYVALRLGRPMFADRADDASRTSALFEQLPALEWLPEGERAVLHKALAKEPHQRYPTCRTFIAELGRAVDEWVAR